MTVVAIEYAVELENKVYWFSGYVTALYFALDNKADLIQKIEYDNGEKHYKNEMTGGSKIL